jgi:hypothetical protein
MGWFSRVIKHEEENPYAGYPHPDLISWSDEFNTATELDKIYYIWNLEREGATFKIQKPRHFGIPDTELDHFPTKHEVESLVKMQFGGGLYNVTSSMSGRRILKSYTLPGEPLGFVNNPDEAWAYHQRGKSKTLKQRMDQFSGDVLIEYMSEDPTIARTIVMGMMKKQLGIDIGLGDNRKQQQIDELLDSDPDLKKKYLMKEAGIRPDKEENSLEGLLKQVRMIEEVKEAFGLNNSSGSWVDGLKDLLKEVAPALPQLAQGMRGLNSGDTVQTPRQRRQIPSAPPAPIPHNPPYAPSEIPIHTFEDTPGMSFAPSGAIDWDEVFNNVNWLVVVQEINWQEMIEGVRGIASEYMEKVFSHAWDDNIPSYQILSQLFAKADIATIAKWMGVARDWLGNKMVVTFANAVGLAELRLVGHTAITEMLEGESGIAWTTDAMNAAVILEGQYEFIDEDAPSETVHVSTNGHTPEPEVAEPKTETTQEEEL